MRRTILFSLQQYLQVVRIAIDRVADPDTAARCEKGVVALLHDPEPTVPALLGKGRESKAPRMPTGMIAS